MAAAQSTVKTSINGKDYTPLLVSLNRQVQTSEGKRFSGLVADSVARLTKDYLAEMGVLGADIEEGPHSTRAVAAAKVYRLTNDLQVVTDRGRWSTATTFFAILQQGGRGGLKGSDSSSGIRELGRCHTSRNARPD